MRIVDRFKSALGGSAAEPAAPPRLDASSTTALSESLAMLAPERRGWITLEEARGLFSAMEAQYAFGEMDDPGKTNLAVFGLRNRAGYDIMPVEGRVYFSRNAG
jgi:hypothetical protein